MRKRCFLILANIQGVKNEAKIKEVDAELMAMNEPQKYDGPEGMEIQHIKRFNETCIILGQHVKKDPKQMTVVEYYQALEIVNKQLKPKK